MGKILDGFLAYLQNTPEEQINKDWAEIKNVGHAGPTVEEFLEQCLIYNDVLNEPWELNLSNKPQKSEEIFGFFFTFVSRVKSVLNKKRYNLFNCHG